jgi:hypothetical protein
VAHTGQRQGQLTGVGGALLEQVTGALLSKEVGLALRVFDTELGAGDAMLQILDLGSRRLLGFPGGRYGLLVFGGVSSRNGVGGLLDLELGGLELRLELAVTHTFGGGLLAQLVQLGVG